jgi:nicotinamidase-related amidase
MPMSNRHKAFFVLSWSHSALSSRPSGLHNGGMTNPTTRAPTALLIIDVQPSFEHMPYWPSGQRQPFQQALLKLQAGCRQAGVPVVHVFHIDNDPPFRADSGLIRPMDWLPGQPTVRFDKHVHNAFTDTGLDVWLRRQGVQRLIISGIRTEQCCETTARVGSDLGYAVDFVSEATLTFPMTHAGTGQTFSAQDITTRTELVLADRFARIVTVDTGLSSL